MAIQMRRGLKAEFNPNKMLPGEWAVAIDNDTQNQIVFMCFQAGVVKRMGTYEDFADMIRQITDDVKVEYRQTLSFDRDTYLAQFDAILANCGDIKNDIIVIQSDITNSLIPEIRGYMQTTLENALAAITAAANANDSKLAAAKSEANANDWSNMSKSWAVGTNGDVREGDNTDNSKWYADSARASAKTAADYVTTAQNLFEQTNLKVESTVFRLNTFNGHLEYTSNAYDFIVDQVDGHLKWEVT